MFCSDCNVFGETFLELAIRVWMCNRSCINPRGYLSRVYVPWDQEMVKDASLVLKLLASTRVLLQQVPLHLCLAKRAGEVFIGLERQVGEESFPLELKLTQLFGKNFAHTQHGGS